MKLFARIGAACQRGFSTVKAMIVTGMASLGLLTLQAYAAVPAEVDTALTAVQTDMLALIGKGFAIVGAIGTLWLVLGGFKKIINKSGS